MYGIWNDFKWQTKLKSNIDLDLGIVFGFDNGVVNENLFIAKGRGLKGNLIFTLNKMVEYKLKLHL